MGLLLLLSAGSATVEAGPREPDEIDRLLAEVKPPARFKDYKPNFCMKEFQFKHWRYDRQPDGTVNDKFHVDRRQVVMDGERMVGWWHTHEGNPGGASGAFVLNVNPAYDVSKRADPEHWWHNPRYGVHTGIDQSLGNWDELSQQVFGGGETIGFRCRWVWKPDGKIKGQRGEALGTSTIRVDAYLGYVLDMVLEYKFKPWPRIGEGRNSQPLSGIGGCMFAQYPQNPWPDEHNYGLCVFTPPLDPEHPWISGNRTERLTPGKRFVIYNWNGASVESTRGYRHNAVRTDGFLGYLRDENGWGFVETLGGDGRMIISAQCPAWAEMGVISLVPEALKPDADGFYRGRVVRRAVGLPPEICDHIVRNAHIRGEKDRSIQVRLPFEDFEGQAFHAAAFEPELQVPHRAANGLARDVLAVPHVADEAVERQVLPWPSGQPVQEPEGD